jgi:hypothetical protein
MTNPALFALILIFCVPVPILWMGWVWFFEPDGVTLAIVNYSILAIGTGAFVWAVGASWGVVPLILFAAVVAHLRMWMMNAVWEHSDEAQRRRDARKRERP